MNPEIYIRAIQPRDEPAGRPWWWRVFGGRPCGETEERTEHAVPVLLVLLVGWLVVQLLLVGGYFTVLSVVERGT